MNELLMDTVVLINWIFTLTTGKFLKFLNIFPYWISLGLISCLVGFAFIPVFKYFSNQRAVRRIRDSIMADLLSIRIFKDNPIVMIRAQGRILSGSLALLWYTLPSLLIMIVPVTFLLTQMGGWYQFRPLKIGEIAVVTIRIASDIDDTGHDILLEPPETVDILDGPVNIQSRNEKVWTIIGRRSGVEPLYFKTSQDIVSKQLSVGGNSLPVSVKRPEKTIHDVFLYPLERPPEGSSLIRSVSLAYGDPVADPMRRLDWIVIFCIVSMLVFLMFKRFFKVVV